MVSRPRAIVSEAPLSDMASIRSPVGQCRHILWKRYLLAESRRCVDHELISGGQLNRKIGGRGTVQDFVDIHGDISERPHLVRPIGDQSSSLRISALITKASNCCNKTYKPFEWTASAASILKKLAAIPEPSD